MPREEGSVSESKNCLGDLMLSMSLKINEKFVLLLPVPDRTNGITVQMERVEKFLVEEQALRNYQPQPEWDLNSTPWKVEKVQSEYYPPSFVLLLQCQEATARYHGTDKKEHAGTQREKGGAQFGDQPTANPGALGRCKESGANTKLKYSTIDQNIQQREERRRGTLTSNGYFFI